MDEKRLRKLSGQPLKEARTNPDDWKKNSITLGNKVSLAVVVMAAEADGWRAEAGISLGGKVIEDPKYKFESKWVKTFEAAEDEAKKMARKLKIKWNPKPYGDRSKVK